MSLAMFLSPLDLHPADARAMHPLKRTPALPKGPSPWATGHFRTLNCSEKIAFGVISGISR